MSIKNYTENTSQFIPRNAEKYCGRYPILVRSSWERMFFQWLDLNSQVIKWSSENLVVKYFDPIQKKFRRYYPDAYVLIEDKSGKYKEYIIEIKPEKETRPPSRRGKKSLKTLHHQEATYITNQAKFLAAQKQCEKMGMEFKVLTEKQLFKNGY